MIVVAIIGVLAAIAIVGVRRYLASSKTAEAKNSIGTISRAAAAAYEHEAYSNQLLADGATSSTFMHQLCGGTSWVPSTVPGAKKYQPNTADGSDFKTGDALNGWKCLKFEISMPVYYQYAYLRAGFISDVSGQDFEAAAQGDVDGNSTLSKFARAGVVRNGSVVESTELYIDKEYE